MRPGSTDRAATGFPDVFVYPDQKRPMSRTLPEQMTAPEVDVLSPMLTREGESWTADYQGLTLRTALQPIFSISHKRVVGYEALIRAFDTDNAAVLPLHLFELYLVYYRLIKKFSC